MKKVDLGQSITILANVGVLAGIVLLAYELRQNSEALRLQAAQAHLNTSYEVDMAIAQDDALATLLLSPAEDRTIEDQFQYERFANSTLMSWQNSYNLYRQGVLSEELWKANTANISRLINGQEDLRLYRERFRSSYTPAFNAVLDSLQVEPIEE